MAKEYEDHYLLSRNSDDAESERLALLEATYDPDSRAHLISLGLGEGWHCLEVGSGRGSNAQWLAEMVGPAGHVLAVDINTRFLGTIARPNLEVRAANIVTDEFESEKFDLVFSRAVLEHLTDWGRALDRMVAALKPGGVLYLSDGDYSGDFARVLAMNGAAADGEHFAHTFRHIMQTFDKRGMIDLGLARRLSLELEARGLVNVGNVGLARVSRPTDTITPFWAQTLRHMQTMLVTQGIVSEPDMRRMQSVFEDPALRWVPHTMCCAWGQRR